MFLEYFDNLREKPKDVRKRHALFLTSIITGIVVLIWIAGILISNYGSRSPDSGVDTDGNGQTEDITTLFNSSNTFMEEGSTDFDAQNTWEMELQSSLQSESKVKKERATSSQEVPKSNGTNSETSVVNTLQ